MSFIKKTIKVYRAQQTQPSIRLTNESDLVINCDGEIVKDRFGLFVRDPKPYTGEDVPIKTLTTALTRLEERVSGLECAIKDGDDPYHVEGLQHLGVRGFQVGDRVGYRHRDLKGLSPIWSGVVIPRPYNARERGRTGDVFVYVMRVRDDRTVVFGVYPQNLEKL